LPSEVGVRGAVDLAHAANANLVGDLVRADACARRVSADYSGTRVTQSVISGLAAAYRSVSAIRRAAWTESRRVPPIETI
jgi:hypothetical protein